MYRNAVTPRYQIVLKGGVIFFVQDQPLAALKGFAKWVRLKGLREKKDRLYTK